MHLYAVGLASFLLIGASFRSAVAQFNQCSGDDSCMNIRDCARFGPHFNEPAKWSAGLRDEFRKRVCQREKVNGVSVFKVCCPRPNVEGRKHGLDLLDLEGCGRYTEDKIAFGQDAKLFQYPWMALLRPKVGSFTCGGTLLNERYVLTAAHCLRNVEVAFVRLGEYDLNSTIDCDKRDDVCALEPQEIAVERNIIHEDYSARSKVNDIGLIRLAQKASLNDNVLPICLPVSPQFRTIQTVYFVAGWGQTHNADFSNKLQFTKLNLVPKDECHQRLLQKDPYVKIVDTQVCAIGTDLSDNCSGDSGGPLKSISINAHYVQYGVVSFGLRSCGKHSAPGVYTKVENYIDWILDKIEE